MVRESGLAAAATMIRLFTKAGCYLLMVIRYLDLGTKRDDLLPGEHPGKIIPLWLL
jgi:hypothetical protein